MIFEWETFCWFYMKCIQEERAMEGTLERTKKQLEKYSYKQQTFFRPGNRPPQRYKIMKLNCIYIRLTCMIYVSNILPTNFFNSLKESHCLLILFKSKVPSFLVQHFLLSSHWNWTKLDIRRIDRFSDPILCPFY